MPSTTPTQFDPDAFHASLDLLHGYNPHKVYLTHYGELKYSSQLADMLRAQLDVYCDRARTGAGQTPELASSLTELCADFAGLIKGAPPRDRLLRQLAFDADLNAQGLQVWLARQTRARQD